MCATFIYIEKRDVQYQLKCFYFNGPFYVRDVWKQNKIGEKQNMKHENRYT